MPEPTQETAPSGEEQVTRTEVRPGLTMIKRVTTKPDGRYLIYYDFERSPGAAETAGS
jgi:hypothetical protein